MDFSITKPLDGMGGSTSFGLTQNYAAGSYSPTVSLPTGSGSSQPEWLKWIDDIVGAADKITSIYERYDYPSWKRALDAKEIEALKAQQERAKADQAQAAAGGVPWVWVAVAAAGAVVLVLVLK